MAAPTSPEAGRRDGGPAKLGALIAAWVGLAVVACSVSLLVAPPATSALDAWQVAGLWSIAFLAGVVHVRVVLHGATEAITLNEVGVVPVVLLLEPSAALLVGATAGLTAEAIITRGQLAKLAFNTSWQIVGLAAAAWSYHAIGGGTFTASPRPLLAALLAAAVYVSINLAAITGLLTVRTERGLRETIAEEAPSSVLLGYGLAQVGILAAVMLVEAPWALPLLALPAVLYRGRARARSEGLAGIAIERDRFERTIAGSSDGVVMLDPIGRVEVWNRAMVGITELTRQDAVGRTLPELGWAALLEGVAPTPATVVDGPRVHLNGRTLRVRANRTGGRTDTRTVLLVRDVTREAELARLQEELVTRVSHEIRTPLTTVMGLLDTLDRHWGDLTPDRRYDLVVVASRGGRRLGRLVANLESLARLEARGTDVGAPAEQSTSVRDVLDEVVRSAERQQVPNVVASGEPCVATAADDLRVILENLIGNAELYGAPPVEVVVERDGDDVALVVSDHGPGVPQELRAHLFEPFFQGDEGGLRRTARGLGLGLAIVRSLAAASGGTVRYEPVAGGGARFTVRLPAAARPVQAAEVSADPAGR